MPVPISPLSTASFLWICETLSSQLRLKLPVADCVRITRIHCFHSRHRHLIGILEHIESAVTRGKSLIGCLFKVAPPEMAVHLTGEETDNSLDVLSWLVRYYRLRRKRNRDIKDAILYPMMLVVMMGLMIAGVHWFIVPHYHDIMPQLRHELAMINTVMAGVGLSTIMIIFILAWYQFRELEDRDVGEACELLGTLMQMGLSWKYALIAIGKSSNAGKAWHSFSRDFVVNPQFALQFTTHFNPTPSTSAILGFIASSADNYTDILRDLGTKLTAARHTAWLTTIRYAYPVILAAIGVMILVMAKLLLSPFLV